MSVRKLMLFLGVFLVLAGLGLSVLLIKRITSQLPQPTVAQVPTGPAVLVALRALPTGTLLRTGDFGWKEVAVAQIKPSNITRGMVSEGEFMGAITRRDFAESEALNTNDLVKPSDRRFLAAVLKPGYRAVSIAIDAPQSASGLTLPGDYVDIILTQSFAENVASAARRSVGETILSNLRVVAVERSLGAMTEGTMESAAAAATRGAEPKPPKTISLEVDEQQAQILFVALQLGKLQIAVRPLAGSGRSEPGYRPPQKATWAVDVSPAIKEVAHEVKSSQSSGSTLEGLVRRPPPPPETVR